MNLKATVGSHRRQPGERRPKVLSLLLLLLLTLPAVVQAQFSYDINVDDTITITGYYGGGGAVDIPDNINSYPVTRIGAGAFTGTSVTSVTIPYSVTSIGFAAFTGCTSLSGITVDYSNPLYSSVDGVLFNKTQTRLIQYPRGKAGSSYAIPNSVTNIASYAFASCTSLNALTVDALNSIFSSADGVLFNKSQTVLVLFPGGKAGSSYTIPNSVTSLGAYAFPGCTSLVNVTIPNSVYSIGEAAFSGCTSLTNVTIPNSVITIENYAFEGCTSLTSVTIPNSVTTIGHNAFFYCTSLTSVTLGNGVTSIGGFTFYHCTRLASVTIPDSVTSIESYAFAGCTNLTGVYFQGNAPSVGVVVFYGPNNATVYYLPGTTGWGPTFATYPAVLWNPLVQTSGPSFGVGPAGFGFNITGTTNIPIVVEATTNLAHGPWVPLQSLNLTNGAFYFSDPNWTNYPARNYRIRSP